MAPSIKNIQFSGQERNNTVNLYSDRGKYGFAAEISVLWEPVAQPCESETGKFTICRHHLAKIWGD